VAGLAVVSAMEASLAQQRRPVTLSARYLYEKAKTVDRFGAQAAEGTDIAAALYVAESFGAPAEERWPYVAGSRELPKGVTWKQMDEAAAKYRARTFRLAGYDDIAGQLAQGRPVVAAVNVTDAWMSEAAAKTGTIKLDANEKSIGLHAVVIVAADPRKSTVRFANSWGTDWGANGFGTMSAVDAKKAVTAMWAIDVPPAEP
jgi:C1A family cysteine protease